MSGIRIKQLQMEEIQQDHIEEIIQKARTKNWNKYNQREPLNSLLHGCAIDWSFEKGAGKTQLDTVAHVWKILWTSTMSSIAINLILDLTLLETNLRLIDEKPAKVMVDQSQEIENAAAIVARRYDTRKEKEKILFEMLETNNQDRVKRVQEIISVKEADKWEKYMKDLRGGRN